MRDPLSTGDLTRRGVYFDVALALGLMTIAIPVTWSQGASTLVASTLVGLALAVRRLAPSVMIVVTLASAAVQVAAMHIAFVASLAYALPFYTLGTHPDRRVRWSSLVVGILGCGVAGWTITHAYPGNETNSAGRSVFFDYSAGFVAAAIVVVGGWTVGLIRYQRRTVEQARVAETIAQLERRRVLDLYAEQSERTRLARDMHDVVAHSLAVVIAQADGARLTFDGRPDDVRRALGVIANTAREALTDVRGMLDQLRREDTSAATDDDRRHLFERMRSAGMILDVIDTGRCASPDPVLSQVSHRVLTEALTNALKYADLTEPVVVEQDWTKGYRLRVRNRIADVPLSSEGAGYGITGMSERAAQAGGSLSATAIGYQWLVDLRIPFDARETHA